MKNYDINQEIQKYYKISVFLNKYIVILWSLVLSFILIFVFNVKSNKVLAYTSSDILIKTLNENKEVIWKDTNKFNKNSKYIKAILQFTNSKQDKLFSDLWIWIFTDDFGIYYPMNVRINNRMFIGVKNKKDILKKYIKILKKSKKLNNKIIKPKIVIEDDKKVINDYNLWCMDTYLNNSVFCNMNKNHLLNDLITKNIFDISEQFYNKLFSNLALSQEKKCIILSKIYSKKYNFNKIKNILKQNSCNIELYKKADEFIKEIGFNNENLFNIKDTLPSDYDVLMQKLTQQFYVIVTQDNIPNYIIYANIKLLKNMIRDDQMDPITASLAINVFNNLIQKDSFKKKVDKNKLISAIYSLEKWNDLEKWLNSYLNSKLRKSLPDNNNVDMYKYSKIHVVSVREKLNYIFTQKYKKIFTVTKKIKYDDKKKIAYLEWFINLTFKVNRTIKQIPLKISFNVKNIIWTKFDIYNLKFLNKKISDYIQQNNIVFNPSSLIDLKEKLENKLYAPLVNNDYWQYNNISVCDKIRTINSSYTCSNGNVSVSLNSYNVSLIFKLDKNLKVKKVSVSNKKIKYDLKNILKERIDIDLSKIIKKVNGLINKHNWYNYKAIWIIKKIVELNIKKTVKQNKLRLSWLTVIEKVELNKKFKKYLWTDIELVRKFHTYYRVFFKLDWKVFWVLYDKNKNNIKAISIYVPDKSKNFIFKNIDLKLADIDQEKLNWFKMDPLNFLKNKDENKYNEYISFIKKNK